MRSNAETGKGGDEFGRKDWAGCPLGGGKQYMMEAVVSGSSMGSPFSVRKWSSGLIFQHISGTRIPGSQVIVTLSPFYMIRLKNITTFL